MLRRGYSKELICGTICASGTLGQIIPPSVILILLGDIMGVSVGDLYIGAVVPGLVLVGLYILYLAILSWSEAAPRPGRRRSRARGLPRGRLPAGHLALLPALALIVGVLGSIFAGVASPTEAASVGAAGGLLLTMLKGRFSMDHAPRRDADHHPHHQPGLHHPGRRQLLRARVPGTQRRPPDSGLPQEPAVRSLRRPGGRHVRDLPAGLLHRLLRDLLHPRPDPGRRSW